MMRKIRRSANADTLKKETIAVYSYSQDLLPEISKYLWLNRLTICKQQKICHGEGIGVSCISKTRRIWYKKVSAKILKERSKAVSPKDKGISVFGQRGPNVNKSVMKQIIREEFQEFIGSAFSDPRPNRYNQHGGQPF